MSLKITAQYNYFIHPSREKDNPKKALFVSIVLGILTLGILHIVFACLKGKVIKNPPNNNTTTKAASKSQIIHPTPPPQIQSQAPLKQPDPLPSLPQVQPPQPEPDLSESNPIYKYPIEQLRGNHEKEISFPGYDPTILKATQEYLESKKIPLHVCPMRPAKSYEMDKVKAQAYVASLPEKYRDVMQKAIDNAQYISMEKFDQALKGCVKELMTKIGPSYSVGMVCGKSMQWVASLALKDTDRLPDSWFPLSSEQETVGIKKTPKSEIDLRRVKEDTLVLFDDMSFSGEQLQKNLRDIKYAIKEHHCNAKKLIVVVPFMTQVAYDMVQTFIQDQKEMGFNLTIELITTDERLRTVKEIFTKEEGAKICNVFEIGYFSWKREDLHLPGTTTLAWSPWRKPDGKSFEPGFGTKAMLAPDLADPTYLETISEDRYFMPTDIPRPYAISL